MPRISDTPSEEDVFEAMRDLGSFLDITPSDARELYRLAHAHALSRLRSSVRVADLMTAPAITLAPETTVAEAARVLAQARISGAPVTRGRELLGVVSVKDFLAALGLPKDAPPVALVAWTLAGRACRLEGLESAPVESVMTAPAMTVCPEATAAEAAKLMADKGIRRLPVIKDGELAGIVTHTDLVRAFGDLLEDAP
jgi:CBS domain-containing protein